LYGAENATDNQYGNHHKGQPKKRSNQIFVPEFVAKNSFLQSRPQIKVGKKEYNYQEIQPFIKWKLMCKDEITGNNQ
jgi:hypothetical protein